ncbi:MAG TPA: NTP transferase domain-containing protein [Candidatus Kapabacteria bacterium]|nr:NTP transferase domain-containing protein [Candidatus Kapabacteria bacterium]
MSPHQPLSNVGVVILAAGAGTRMKSTLPKVMHLLHGKPLIDHVVTTASVAVAEKPIVVVCKDHTLVQDYLQDRATYAIQEQQLGTGHAAACAESLLKGRVHDVVVLNGDMPFITPASLGRLITRHRERDNTVTLMTVTIPDFEGNNAPFYSFGRIVRRKEDGHIARIVEKKDATPEELAIREVNASYFCFKAEWLWNNIHTIQNNNSQEEYYLVDLIKIAIDQGEKISSIDLDPLESIGVNTQDDLHVANAVAQKVS